jgi:hypothetical protein
MKIKNIWKSINTSTLLVLPIYSDICSNAIHKNTLALEIPFLQVCFESGLINTFLEDTFKIMFEKEKITQDLIVFSESVSLSELIIADKHFRSVVFADDNIVVYELDLPKEFKADIKLIKQSEYSKVSKRYKSKLLITQTEVAELEVNLSNRIVRYNVPYSIVSKSKHLKDDLVAGLSINGGPEVKVGDDVELFPKFNTEKETFKQKLIC